MPSELPFVANVQTKCAVFEFTAREPNSHCLRQLLKLTYTARTIRKKLKTLHRCKELESTRSTLNFPAPLSCFLKLPRVGIASVSEWNGPAVFSVNHFLPTTVQVWIYRKAQHLWTIMQGQETRRDETRQGNVRNVSEIRVALGSCSLEGALSWDMHARHFNKQKVS